MQVKVRATRKGFYGVRERVPGEASAEFTLEDPIHFSANWMEVIDENAPEQFEQMADEMRAEARAAHAEGREANLKAIEKRYVGGNKRSGGRRSQKPEGEGAGDLTE